MLMGNSYLISGYVPYMCVLVHEAFMMMSRLSLSVVTAFIRLPPHVITPSPACHVSCRHTFLPATRVATCFGLSICCHVVSHYARLKKQVQRLGVLD